MKTGEMNKNEKTFVRNVVLFDDQEIIPCCQAYHNEVSETVDQVT